MGKTFAMAVGAGLLAQVLLTVYDSTIGPMISRTLGGVVGGVTGGGR